MPVSILTVVLVGMGFAAATPLPAVEAAGRSVLQRVDVAAGEDGAVRVALSCQPPPSSFRASRSARAAGTVEVRLDGYRSQAAPEIAAAPGLPAVTVTEEENGSLVEIRAPALDFSEVRLEGGKLVVVLRGPLAAAAGGVDMSYRVGPGDLLAISVFGQDDLSRQVRVVSNGTINFPLVGDLFVAGLTPAAITARLSELLARDYVVNPQVLVGVAEYQSQWVNLIGSVQRPAKYYLKGPTRLIDILSEAGGLTEGAGSEIVITRVEPSGSGPGAIRKITVSAEDLFAGRGSHQDLLLAHGDIVQVPPAPFFYIRGEVGRPGQYALRSETTLQKAISLAGGFSQWADEKDVQIIREAKGEQQKITVNMRKVARGEAPDVKIEPDDIILVTRRIL
jgi:polysaccharide export outer membrane protein